MARVVARLGASMVLAIAGGASLFSFVACGLSTSGLFDASRGVDASAAIDASAGGPGDDAAGNVGDDDAGGSDGAIDGAPPGDDGGADADAAPSTGALSITVVQNSPTKVALDQLGPLDWVHWGLKDETSVDRKDSITPIIASFVPIGTSTVTQLSDDITAFSWKNGTPNDNENGTTTAVYVEGANAGFALDVGAGTAMRTLTVYIGGYQSDGQLTASLSDQSAPDEVATPASDHGGNWYATATIAYRAASAGQKVSLRWVCTTDYGGVFTTGNVTLRAATLE